MYGGSSKYERERKNFIYKNNKEKKIYINKYK